MHNIAEHTSDITNQIYHLSGEHAGGGRGNGAMVRRAQHASQAWPGADGASSADADAMDDMELTAGDLFDAVCERVAEARTRALMGETEQAQRLFREAARDYAQYGDVFAGLPGHLSLAHDLDITRQMLRLDSVTEESPMPLPDLTPLPAAPSIAEPKQRVRRRAPKAA